MANENDLQRMLEWLDTDEPAWSEFLTINRTMWPPYRSESELRMIRNESRWFATHHPFALAALENRASYTVGTGHNYTVRLKAAGALTQDIVDRIEQEIVEFTERNDWQHRQIENQMRLDRDGEVFLRLFDVDGYLTVRYVEPEQVTTPTNYEGAFGVIADPEDAETINGYWVMSKPQFSADAERVLAEEIQHRKANVDRTMPRGLPILYAVRMNLRRVWKLLRNMTTVASIQAAVAIVRQHGAATAGGIQQFATRMSRQIQQAKQDEPKTYEQFPPGSIIDVAPGIDIRFPAEGINVANYVAAIQAELRAIAARLAIPEYMLSGDASNANYSSTLVAEGPAVKAFERLQSQMAWWDTDLLMKAIKLAEQSGRLPQGVSDQVVIDAEGPVIQSRNRLMDVQADQILLTMGVVSPQTIAARYGFNYEQERDLMDQANE